MSALLRLRIGSLGRACDGNQDHPRIGGEAETLYSRLFSESSLFSNRKVDLHKLLALVFLGLFRRRHLSIVACAVDVHANRISYMGLNNTHVWHYPSGLSKANGDVAAPCAGVQSEKAS